MVLLPRGTDHNYPFHDATDAHSSELQQVGWGLCDSAGRLKVRSIKDAEWNCQQFFVRRWRRRRLLQIVGLVGGSLERVPKVVRVRSLE